MVAARVITFWVEWKGALPVSHKAWALKGSVVTGDEFGVGFMTLSWKSI